MSNVVRLFADNNVVDFATKQMIVEEVTNVDYSLAERRALKNRSSEKAESVVVSFYPQFCA